MFSNRIVKRIDSSDGVSSRIFNFFKDFVANDLRTKDLGEDSIKAGLLVYGSSGVLQLAPTHQKTLLKVFSYLQFVLCRQVVSLYT